MGQNGSEKGFKTKNNIHKNRYIHFQSKSPQIMSDAKKVSYKTKLRTVGVTHGKCTKT